MSTPADLAELMRGMGQAAVAAAAALSLASTPVKNRALGAAAAAIRAHRTDILNANAEDLLGTELAKSMRDTVTKAISEH